jgi:arginyl-tRNA synthetase
MTNSIHEIHAQIREIIMAAMGRAVADEALPPVPAPAFSIETPADPSHGDFATNAAMVSAKAFRLPPRKIAEIIRERMDFTGTLIERAEVAGPGFINFFVSGRYFSEVLQGIHRDGNDYGKSDFGKGKKVLVEFVSANPTGPMHIGNSRGGALGDCLASVLEYAGYYVEREFYVNDAGNQIQKFALSLDIRYQQLFKGEEAVELPEDSYHGADITELAKEFADLHGDSFLEKSEEERRKALVDYALPRNIARMKTDIAKYRITYDTWFLESTLHSDGEVKEIIDILTEKGLTYEKDGALWYKATDFGGEKDEVLVRANGNPTYFAADIAYHRNKFAKRGFDTCIDVWGADHHGHVARMKGAMDAIGLDGSKLDIVLMQLVNLMDNGVRVKVSKRTGKAIQLADLLDEISVDAARFLFNLREANTVMDFDLGLAVREDSQNPVYYVQYAHARICSIFRREEAKKYNLDAVPDEALDLLTHPSEVELIRYLSALPNEIIAAAKDYEPSRMTRYVIEIASKYHRFYHDCRVLGNEDDNLTAARLLLCDCVRQVIANILAMMKVTAPEQMIAEEN